MLGEAYTTDSENSWSGADVSKRMMYTYVRDEYCVYTDSVKLQCADKVKLEAVALSNLL